MTPEQSAVLAVIPKSPSRIHQREIARACPNLGCHERERLHVEDPMESTLRRVRGIIHDLRVQHLVPILSDAKGYFMPADKDEAVKVLGRIEREAKSRMRSSMETYEALASGLDVRSEFFEGLRPTVAAHTQPSAPEVAEERFQLQA